MGQFEKITSNNTTGAALRRRPFGRFANRCFRGAIILAVMTSWTTPSRAINLAVVGVAEDSINVGVNLLTTSSQSTLRARSVGVLRIRRMDNGNLNTSNCGATFVTPHLAITANHCVTPDFGYSVGASIQLDQIDTTSFAAWSIFNQAMVYGTWNGDGPQFNQFSRPYRTGPQENYFVSSYECHVYAVCDASFQPTTSPACDFVSPDADLAVISCPGRNAPGDFVNPRRHDRPVGTAVEVRWFHEIVDLTDHYAQLDTTNETNNYHYSYNPLIDSEQQYFPLLSIQNANNQPYVITEDHANLPEVAISARSCHGMSGSGVFEANSDAFLGPVVGGFATNLLCDDMRNPNPPDIATSYVRVTYVNRLWRNLLDSSEY